jgi:hypothetical protein
MTGAPTARIAPLFAATAPARDRRSALSTSGATSEAVLARIEIPQRSSLLP